MRHFIQQIIVLAALTVTATTYAQPQAAKALLRKADNAFTSKKTDSAIFYITAAIQLSPPDAGLYARRGRYYWQKNDSNSAIADYTKAIELTDAGTDKQQLESYYHSRGTLYGDKKEWTFALKDLNRSISLSNLWWMKLNERGKIYLNLGKYDLAIRDYTQSIDLDSSQTWTYLERSTVYSTLKEFDMAIADCNKAIALDPGDPLAYAWRAQTYDLMQQYDLAIADISTAIKMRPLSVYYADRAFYYSNKGAYDLAINDYNTAMTLNPGYSNNAKGKSDQILTSAEYEKAMSGFKQTNTLKRDYAFAHIDMIFLLARAERFADAVAYYKKYQDLDAKEHFDYPGWSYVQYYINAVVNWLPQNNYEQALNEIRLAEKNYDNMQGKKNSMEVSHYTSVIALKGYLLEKLDYNAEARDAYKQALVINANQPEVVKALAVVEKKLEMLASQDHTAPVIELISPQSSRSFEIESDFDTTQLVGRVKDISGIAEVKINGRLVDKTEEDGLFIAAYTLNAGRNQIVISAKDKQGNTSEKTFTINNLAKKKTNEPEIPAITDVPPKYYAILIAEKDYLDNSITDLQKPVRDAMDLKNILQSRYTFEAANIDTLYNRSREDIMQAILYRCNTLFENDNLLIFYAGHGTAEKDQFGDVDGYWIPVSAKLGVISTYISANDINVSLKRSKAKHILLVADACFSGAFTRSLPGANIAIQKQYKVRSRKVMTSGNMELVSDGSKFIYYLQKSLVENSEKYLSAKDLFDSFYKAVINNTDNLPQYAPIKNVGDEGGEFVFIKK